MKSLQKGSDKIQHICDAIKKETLAPAKKEAEEIVKKARKEAEEIITNAEKSAGEIVEAARECMERERSVFNSSLSQACKQGLESLRQEIEHRLFNEELESLIKQGASDTELIAKLIHSMIEALEKEGLGVDLSAFIPKTLSPEAVNKLLARNVLLKLREGSVLSGSFSGGAQVKVHDKKLTIDISDEALKERLSTYLHKGFRQLLFNN